MDFLERIGAKEYMVGVTVVSDVSDVSDYLIKTMKKACEKVVLCVDTSKEEFHPIDKHIKSTYSDVIVKHVPLPKINKNSWKERLHLFTHVVSAMQPLDPDVYYSKTDEEAELFEDFIKVL